MLWCFLWPHRLHALSWTLMIGLAYPFILLQASWVRKMMDRVNNVEKTRKRVAVNSLDETPRKRGRPKRVISLETRYPSIRPQGDERTQQEHVQALSKELGKDKPRKEILLPLMKSTFYERRQYILNSCESVLTKLEKYPALRMPPLVCL